MTPPGFDPATSNPWGLEPALPAADRAGQRRPPPGRHPRGRRGALPLFHPAQRDGHALRRRHRPRLSLRARHLHDPPQGQVAELAPDGRDDRPRPRQLRPVRRTGCPAVPKTRSARARSTSTSATATPCCASTARPIRPRSAGGRRRAACAWSWRTSTACTSRWTSARPRYLYPAEDMVGART